MTTIGVGVLLLLAAVAYVIALSRVNGAAASDSSRPDAALGAPPAGAALAATGYSGAEATWAAPPHE
jgi:hypothetical protein